MKRPTARQKRLAKEKALWAEFGLKRPQAPRYVGLQGILWFLVSKVVRAEDFAEYGGLCVDGCGQRVEHWRDADCGHFQTAGKASTRFMRENLALQTRYCNTLQKWGESKQYSFGLEINRRHGEGTAERIIEISKQTANLSKEWLREQIFFYKRRAEELGIIDASIAGVVYIH